MAVIKVKNPKYTGSDSEPKYITIPNIINPIEEVYIGNIQPTGNEIIWINPEDSSIKFKNGEEWVSIELNSSGGASEHTLDLSPLFDSEGSPVATVSDEFLAEVKKAYEEKYSNALVMGGTTSLSIDYSAERSIIMVYFLNHDILGGFRFKIDNSTKSLKTDFFRLQFSVLGSGTKALTDNGQYAEFASPTKVVSGGSGTVTKQLSPNTLYEFGECTSLTITLASEISGIRNEYMFEFVSGATPTMLSIPETVGWMGGKTPTIEENKTYQCSIVNNIAVMGGK